MVSHGDLLAVLVRRPTSERKAGKLQFHSKEDMRGKWQCIWFFTFFACHKMRVSPTAVHKSCRNLHLSLENLPQDFMQYITWKIYTIFPLSVLYIISVTNLLLSGTEQAICCSSVRDDMW